MAYVIHDSVTLHQKTNCFINNVYTSQMRVNSVSLVAGNWANGKVEQKLEVKMLDPEWELSCIRSMRQI